MRNPTPSFLRSRLAPPAPRLCASVSVDDGSTSAPPLEGSDSADWAPVAHNSSEELTKNTQSVRLEYLRIVPSRFPKGSILPSNRAPVPSISFYSLRRDKWRFLCTVRSRTGGRTPDTVFRGRRRGAVGKVVASTVRPLTRDAPVLLRDSAPLPVRTLRSGEHVGERGAIRGRGASRRCGRFCSVRRP